MRMPAGGGGGLIGGGGGRAGCAQARLEVKREQKQLFLATQILRNARTSATPDLSSTTASSSRGLDANSRRGAVAIAGAGSTGVGAAAVEVASESDLSSDSDTDDSPSSSSCSSSSGDEAGSPAFTATVDSLPWKQQSRGSVPAPAAEASTKTVDSAATLLEQEQRAHHKLQRAKRKRLAAAAAAGTTTAAAAATTSSAPLVAAPAAAAAMATAGVAGKAAAGADMGNGAAFLSLDSYTSGNGIGASSSLVSSSASQKALAHGLSKRLARRQIQAVVGTMGSNKGVFSGVGSRGVQQIGFAGQRTVRYLAAAGAAAVNDDDGGGDDDDG